MKIAILCLLVLSAGCARPEPVRVCADPNNLPFTNAKREGFENKIAELLARDLGARVEYTWWAQRRGFIRNTLNARRCDVVMGLPARVDLAQTTRPYYRSSYVFVTRRARHLDIASFDDARLRQLRIGVPLIGDDSASAPPAHALARRGVVSNVSGYSVFGDYREDTPPAALIVAVARGDIDVAAAWGPLAGYAAKRSGVPLTVTPIIAGEQFSPQQFQFEIAMGVRKGDHALRDRLNDFIAEHGAEIRTLLQSYGVPLVEDRLSSAGERR